jgi:hypothetical protein
MEGGEATSGLRNRFKKGVVARGGATHIRLGRGVLAEGGEGGGGRGRGGGKKRD